MGNLKSGSIVAEGNHKELMQSSEDYRRIFGKKMTLTESKINDKRG